MRNRVQNTANIVAFPARPTFERRSVQSFWRGLTCIVLVRHGQTDKAIKVSDNGDSAKAVWVPKAMVTIEMPSERGILVATMSKAFAEQKRLSPRFIDPTQFNQATAEVLAEAEARAARKRNSYRGYRQPTQHCMNGNVFA